jgi:glycosyltransferase involved in cell wall biosynthesis
MRATLLLLTFNQESFAREAALSCLAQDCEPIEIIFSDDASSDQTFQVLQEIAQSYTGPHRLKVRRNETNAGIGEHYNQLIDLAGGSLLVTAAGDDVSEVSRVRKVLAAWDQANQVPDLISADLVSIGESGETLRRIMVDDLSDWQSPEQWLKKRPYVVGAGHAFTKRLHQRFGPFLKHLSYEDQVMALRASCLGGGLTIREPLVKYRAGGLSGREKSFENGEAYRRYLLKRHSSHLGLYEQVQADLMMFGTPESFPRKMRARLARASVFVAMLQAPSTRVRLGIVRQHFFKNIISCVACIQALPIASAPGLFAWRSRAFTLRP